MPIRKVTILETYYDDKRDLVEWLVEDIASGKKVALCWPGSDLGPAVGVNAKLTPDLIRGFCKDIKGKTINLDSQVKKEKKNKEIKDMSHEEILAAHDDIDQYPFHEVLDILKEMGSYKDSLEDIKQESKSYPNILDFTKNEN